MGLEDATHATPRLDVPDADDVLPGTGNGEVSVARQGHGGHGRPAFAPERVDALAAKESHT